MRLCIIGDSHVAALRLGWDQIAADFPDVELVFFGSHGTSLSGLEMRDGILVPADALLARKLQFTSGGLSRIVLTDYAALLIYATNLRVPRLDRRMSAAIQSTTLADMIAGSLNLRLAQLARSASDIPLFLAHAPLQSSLPGVPASASDDWMGYDDILAEIERRIILPGLRLLRQPAETRAPGLHTKAEYSVGSVRLDAGAFAGEAPKHDEADRAHMNARYGARFLATHLPTLQAASRPSACSQTADNP